jgi:hypothetical protein
MRLVARSAHACRRTWNAVVQERPSAFIVLSIVSTERVERAAARAVGTIQMWSTEREKGFPARISVCPASNADSGIVRWPHVGELGKQIAVGPYLLPRHSPIREDSQKDISGIVGERPAIARE